MIHRDVRNSKDAERLYRFLEEMVKQECSDGLLPSWNEVKQMSKIEYMERLLESIEEELSQRCLEKADIDGMRYFLTEVYKKLFGEIPKIERTIRRYRRKSDEVGCRGDYPTEPFDPEYLEETVYADERI